MSTCVWVPGTHIKPAGGMPACILSSTVRGELKMTWTEVEVLLLSNLGVTTCVPSQVWSSILYKKKKQKC